MSTSADQPLESSGYSLPPHALDLETWAALRELDDDADGSSSAMLYLLFIESSVEYLANTSAALERRDAKSLHAHAHALKGSAAAVGLQRIACIAGFIEDRATKHQLDDLAPALEALSAECAAAPWQIAAARSAAGLPPLNS